MRPENQSIVDALVDYGDSHLHSGHRGKGITHLRAAQAIRNSNTVVLSGKQAVEAIPLVGERVGTKIDQILERGHADSEYEEEEEGEEEEAGSEYGKNQLLVDALATHGEAQLSKRHTGRGTAFLRAALQLRIAEGEVTTGAAAQALGRIGDKVATYIDETIAKVFDLQTHALKLLTTKFGRASKRGRPEPSAKTQSANKKRKSATNQQDDDSQAAGENEPTAVDEEGEEYEEDQEVDEDEGVESLPPHRQVRMAAEIREKPVANAANQKIVDAFTNYGEQQLDRGHTGKGVSHLRAAL
ncbi:hypothetical protein BBJ28_00026913, partial [Nothophytophthora sp. Chile5]